MGREINRLSARRVATLKTPGRHADGAGLYLSISKNGGRRWVFLFRGRKDEDGGRGLREMGLGSARTVSLARARELAIACRQKVADGIDPIKERGDARYGSVDSPTFDECASRFVEAHKPGWRNTKHAKQWANTLATYVSPVIGPVPVGDVNTGHVSRILEPIWTTKTETASRVRGRIEAVLDWAKARGYRADENPARWRGHLDKLLPKRSRVRRVVHHPSLPYSELPDFIHALRSCEGVAARAFEFTILNTVRTGDIVGGDRHEKPPMKWSHVDLEARVWIVPSTKTDKELRLPLSDQAFALLVRIKELNLPGDIVFPGTKSGRPLSNMSMTRIIDRINAGRTTAGLARFTDPKLHNRDVVPHGFRATFKTWAEEQTSFPNGVIEAALAHIEGDKVQAAYMRGDLFEKRRALMTAWANYCGVNKAPSGVVSLTAARANERA